MGANYMLNTYPVSTEPDKIDDAMVLLLEQVRDALGTGTHLAGAASYADMAIACSLQMIQPVSRDYIPLDTAQHCVWQHGQLAQQFHDLCLWRDSMFKILEAPRLGSS